MCNGGSDLKHLAHERQCRVVGLSQGDVMAVPTPGRLARVRGQFAAVLSERGVTVARVRAR